MSLGGHCVCDSVSFVCLLLFYRVSEQQLQEICTVP